MLSPFLLENAQVRLEPLTGEHAAPLAAAAAEDRSSYGFTWVPDGLADARRYVAAALADQAGGRGLPFAVRRPADDLPPSVAEIGSTWYAASCQRTGVNPACKLLLLTRAFEVWGTLRVALKTDARNAASRRAIERLGARPEGVRRAHSPASDGTIRDTAYYSIVEAEWPTIRDQLRTGTRS